ncbi:MAG: DUF2273 domain-containing protein [Clostridia bacterium]|nr:DUF2273 domain-containing protein [Clostridia bacterium]
MEELNALLKKYRWRIIGIVAGIVLAILLFTIGLWRTLLLFALVAVCYVIGSHLDNGGKEELDKAIGKLFSKK